MSEIKKYEPCNIDLVNKIIRLSDNVIVREGERIINRDGSIFFIEWSNEKPQMCYYDDGDKRHYGELTEYYMGEYAKVDISVEELDQEVLDVICEKKSIDDYKDASSDETTSETSLVHLKSSDILLKAQAELEIKKNRAKAIASRLHAMMETKYRKLHAIVQKFEEKLEKIYKVLYTIELYLGVNEDVVQLVQGDKAPLEEPVCLRQLLLYMDEEIGIYENGGIGFQDIPKFDAWISDNFKKIIPEPKCVVAFRIRREKKDYGNAVYNAIVQGEDMKTYFLIRNGNNLYRIWAAIRVHPRLFPLRKEIDEVYKKIKEERHFSEYETKKADNMVLHYQRTSLVLQGIMDRTDIFSPIPEGINIFDPDTYGNAVKLIYDEENVLTDGKLTFNEWQTQINNQIERGSRIIYHYDWSEMRDEYLKYRYFSYRTWYPRAPKDCMFTVEDVIANDEKSSYTTHFDNIIKVLFLEDSWSSDERKKRTAFKLFYKDWFILNYDKISLEDLEYYIHSRVDRPNYLDMLPVLISAKNTRLEELAWEKEFIRMTIEEMARGGKIVSEKDVWAAVNWWKNKVIWKRPITKDDAKALRMIVSKLNKIAILQ